MDFCILCKKMQALTNIFGAAWTSNGVAKDTWLHFSAISACLFESTSGFLSIFLIDYRPLQMKPQAPNPVLTEEITSNLTKWDSTA